MSLPCNKKRVEHEIGRPALGACFSGTDDCHGELSESSLFRCSSVPPADTKRPYTSTM